MYLKYIENKSIERFVQSVTCPNAKTIIVEDCIDRNYVNVFTNMLDSTFHFTDYECINMDNGKIFSALWRKFMITELDKYKCGLGDEYIDGLHSFLEQDTIYGPTL